MDLPYRFDSTARGAFNPVKSAIKLRNSGRLYRRVLLGASAGASRREIARRASNRILSDLAQASFGASTVGNF